MLQGLLLRVLGLATLDVGRVASALADGLLDDYDAGELDPVQTRQYLRTRYMRLVNQFGLPADCCEEVARRAWAAIALLREDEPDAATSDKFAFYD